MLNMFSFYTVVQSIIENLKDRCWNMGPSRNEWGRQRTGALRAEQFPHLGNYTLTPGDETS